MVDNPGCKHESVTDISVEDGIEPGVYSLQGRCIHCDALLIGKGVRSGHDIEELENEWTEI